MDSENAKAYLRPRARLMSTLGEELISNERVALTELVKNAYDADASLVVIRFNAPLAVGSGSIEVWDDGHGMSPGTVRGTWLEIATPHRHRSPQSERLGRRVLGAKGIGRFSAARLAQVTSLTTRRRDEQEVTVRVDWGRFTKDDDAYLDQVPVDWVSGTPSTFGANSPAPQLFDRVTQDFRDEGRPDDLGHHGTLVRLEGLRQQWDEESVTLLKQSLGRLLPPAPPSELDVPDRPDFSVYIETPPGELEHHTGFVGASEALAHPHYRLMGTVDADGQAHLQLRTSHSEAETIIDECLVGDTSKPSCGALTLDIRTWDLEGTSLRQLLNIDVGARSIPEIRQLIRRSSGVALYRDGFRVQPFGESGFDWLGFDLRRVNNPTLRFSNNQVAGFVYISADGNPGLKDRSHREGLIDSPEYEELKARILQAVSRLESWRYKLRRPEQPDEKILSSGTPGHGLFSGFSLDPLRQVVEQRHPDDAVLGRAVEEASETITKGVRKVQEVLSQFQRLATLGTLVDVVLHDGRAALTRIAFVLEDLQELVENLRGEHAELAEELVKVHTGFNTQQAALDHLFTRIQPLSGRRRGRPRSLSLHDEIRAAVEVHEADLAKLGIDLEVGGEDVTVTVAPGDVNTLVLNLVGNAIYWLSTTPDTHDRSILIETGRTPKGEVEITFSDSGPGVRAEVKDVIFDTYFSDKPDGIGLGLTIAGSVVKDFYDGDLSLLPSGPLPGACFQAVLRRRIG
ncbi:sensor histidine kinase [Streptomyces albidoflavus]|uniref:sensor histidine kinase n=1 Tax=Streptomyces albidoflavus TaxID=1886 RepID=UPI0033D7AE29